MPLGSGNAALPQRRWIYGSAGGWDRPQLLLAQAPWANPRVPHVCGGAGAGPGPSLLQGQRLRCLLGLLQSSPLSPCNTSCDTRGTAAPGWAREGWHGRGRRVDVGKSRNEEMVSFFVSSHFIDVINTQSGMWKIRLYIANVSSFVQ